MIAIIAAMDEHRVIGNQGRIPWSVPEDWKHVKEMTSGNVIIMGRKTFESIGKPLPNRINIVVTSRLIPVNGIVSVTSLKEALSVAKTFEKDIFLFGGSRIYEEGMEYADTLFLSLIPGRHEGDTFFPEIREEWKEIHRDKRENFTILTYKKS